MGIGWGKKSSSSGPSGGGKRRAYYPSGPWIDAEGRPTTSPYASTPVTTQTTTGNPNPDNYKIVRASEVGSSLVVEIKYHDCTNYEGKKVLVFENLTLLDLVNQKSIDPHFFPSGSKYKSPIARFEPTERGWEWARSFAATLSRR